MEKLRNLIKDNKFIKAVYKTKTYFDLGVSQVSWVTGKVPEVAGLIIILDYLGIVILPKYMKLIVLMGFISVFCLGLFLRKSGLWVVERKVDTKIDPIADVVYRAAKKILKED